MEAILPVLLFVAIAAVMSVGLVVGSSLIGPNKRTNRVKEMPYESGMDPVHDTRRRFDVRFHLVAITFLVFDVELLFLAARFGIPMVEVPVNWQEIDGSKLDVLTSTIQMAKDIVAIRVCYTLGIWRDKAVPVAPEPTAANALEFVTPPPA